MENFCDKDKCVDCEESNQFLVREQKMKDMAKGMAMWGFALHAESPDLRLSELLERFEEQWELRSREQ